MRLAVLALLLTLGFPNVARAEHDEEPRVESPSAAKQHFERALEEYRRGHYRAAIGALNEAIVLDPESKDLFYNLALVYEKLGELDRAIVALGKYIELERDPVEAERATLTIIRLRGAQEELAAERAEAARAAASESAPRPVVVRFDEPPVGTKSRVDGWIVGGAALAATAAFVGVIFGARALALDADAVSAEDRREVERSAIIADVGLSVGLLLGAGTGVLWVVREPGSGSRTGASWVSLRGTF